MPATDPIAIGRLELRLVSDGRDRVPPEVVFADVPPAELAATVRGHLDADGLLPIAYTCLLIRADDRLVLVDAGLGEFAEPDGGGGLLLDGLRSLGIGPAQIDVVVVTHGHSDHIAGLTRMQAGRQRPVFTAARHYVARAEWEFWTSDEVLAGMHSELADPPRACLPPLAAAGLVELVDGDLEILEGVRIATAAGHTPGHTIVEIESDGHRATFLGDAVFHPLSFVRPEWPCVFDVDRDDAVRSRLNVLERCASNGSLVMASHLSLPGRVTASSGSYRLEEVG